MPVIFPTSAKISPSFTEPEYIVTYAQASGAFAAVSGGKPRVKIGSEDMAVYINALDLRSDVTASQSASNNLPSASLVVTYYNTPTYLIRTRAQWDHHDTARGGDWNVSVPSALDLAAFGGIFQQMRTALLYGFNPANGEGLLNTSGATAVTLPPDSYGDTTVSTYDNGQMALFFLNQIVALKSRMFQSGGNIKNKIVAISPQRVFLQFAEAGIVQVTSYQRPGAGTATTGQVIANVVTENGDSFEWYYDDTLMGQGAGGSDAVLLTMPEIEAPSMPVLNTNVWGSEMQPQMSAVNLMYSDLAAPMSIPTPIPDGAITKVYEQRITSGWCVRPQGIVIISMPH
jgi:hypothetical protein